MITAQNAALTNERTAVQLRGRRYTASVALIRAVGGGWSASDLGDPLATSGDTPPIVASQSASRP